MEPDVVSLPAPGELSGLEPVHSINAFEETLERILQMIKLGLVLPGDRLPSERDLARRLQVSRPTVREAIRSLGQTGYLETRRGRRGGAFVVEWSPEPSPEGARALMRRMAEELLDVLDLRSVVEPGASALVATRATPEDHARLDDALAVLAHAPRISFPAAQRTAGHGADPVADLEPSSSTTAPPLSYRFADRHLHLLIGELTRSRSVATLVKQIQVRLSDLISHTPQMEEALRHSDEQHSSIVAAIKRGDAEEARHAMEEHVSATSSYLRGFLA